MSLDAQFLQYGARRYGMDQDRFEWSILPRRKPVEWPGGARVALWITIALEWFPLDMKGRPFKATGALSTAYPDLRHYTLRDYGNRVGIYRIMKALDTHGIPATVATNAAVASRYPSLVDECTRRGWEIMGHGLDMDSLHFEGLAEDEERKLIGSSLEVLRGRSGQPVRGWLSPAKSESTRTPDLLRRAGVEYVCDWANDEMPYAIRTNDGPLYAMPHPVELEDHAILVKNHHSEDEFRDQVCDQFDTLYGEAAAGSGTILALSLRPWVIGQPYRIGALEEALAHIMRHKGLWPATGAEILDAWRQQQ